VSKGWVAIYRQLLENPIWLSEPFTRGQAWVDLILLANHEANFIRVNGHRIDLQRGQCGWSQTKLCARWKWSRKKARSFLKELVKDGMILLETNNRKNVITLCNYNKYSNIDPTEEPQKNRRRTAEEPQKNRQGYTNNNVNNNNNENKDLEATKINDDIAQAVDAWNQLAKDEGLAIVQKMSAIRKAKLKSRLKDCGGLEGWNIALDKIRGSPGLLGRVGEPWKADFDFLIQEQSFIKLMEGKYDGWTKKNRGSSGPKSFIEAAREIIEEGPEDPDGIPF